MRKLKLEELGRIGIKEFKQSPKANCVFVLDNVRSALNVGSAFRTADAFRIEALFLTGITACPPHKEIMKTAIGATASVDWTYEESAVRAVQKLKSESYQIIGIEQTNQSVLLHKFQPDHQEKVAYIFGNEVEGISEDVLPLLDKAVEIPQFGTKHSINISVCVGIIGWHHFLYAGQSDQ